ncbi:MAG: hypothetical protein GAK45_01009 [Pseudomonas citronellolis]|nr:MAG: hypothetical protein GAK45_01009 [Pseudomonas citronellolis]
MGERSVELVQRHVVALGDGGHRLVQFFIGDADAGALAHLKLDVFDDQALKHLLGQHVLGRQRRTAFLDGLTNLGQALVQLTLHDHVVIDDGHHTIQRYDFGMNSGTGQYCAQHQRAQAIT